MLLKKFENWTIVLHNLKKWCPELEENARNVPKLFVGNKIDLREENDAAPSGKPTYISFQTVKRVFREVLS